MICKKYAKLSKVLLTVGYNNCIIVLELCVNTQNYRKDYAYDRTK